MIYNALKDARYIRNSTLCRYDELSGYTTNFNTNGDVDGWDVYSNVYLYGCWEGILFGTASDNECYIGRTNVISPFDASVYYTAKLMMKITPKDEDYLPTQGKIRWQLYNDSTWNSDKELTFDLYTDDKWHLYIINLGPVGRWQGLVNQLRIYPFIDGKNGDKFAIKYLKITSLDEYICLNTQCSYYSNYVHPCPGAGTAAQAEAGIAKETYTTLSGISDELFVDIDSYGSEIIRLGNNINITGNNMAKIIADSLSRKNIGSYSYAFTEHTEFNKLRIYSGSVGATTVSGQVDAGQINSIRILGGTAAEELGFYADGADISTYVEGVSPATGFDYAGARRLKAFELNILSSEDTTTIAYIHDPKQFNVEAGRRDFNDSSTSDILLGTVGGVEYFDTLQNNGKTIIDVSHPVNDSGRLKEIYVNGSLNAQGVARVYVLRPLKNGTFRTLYYIDLPSENSNYIYTTRHVTYKVDCDFLVNKGDVLAFYDINVLAPFVNHTKKPNAVYYHISGRPGEIVDPGEPQAYGVAGFNFYARSLRLQENVKIEVDLGQRVNIEEVSIYGQEAVDYFEYNIASCLDVNWSVDLYGEYHTHRIINYYAITARYENHQNIAYGEECLNDNIRSADNGQVGTAYGLDSNGLYTTGEHSYFYVNGDAEWLHNGATWYNQITRERHEYGWSDTGAITLDYQYDPISFIITFPNHSVTNIHKSIMYFKEAENFKSFSLSYYLGETGDLGNGPIDNFQLIPHYDSVILDGIEYNYNNMYGTELYEYVGDILFKNPYPKIEPIYIENECINQGQVETYDNLNWNIIEHNFTEVECKGFCIYTNNHVSTKITELELYSKFIVAPTLVDNVDITHSQYGDEWATSVFDIDPLDDSHIKAFIGNGPRYINLELTSQSQFELRNIGFYTSEEIKLDACEDIILLSNVKSGEISNANAITIENVFDVPYDLHVGLPQDLFRTDKILSWMTLNDLNSVLYPEIGPGGLINKNDDYTITNINGQLAINTPCYGLKNIINNNVLYYAHNEEDYLYITTMSGVYAGLAFNSKSRKTQFNFPAVSSKYFKFDVLNTTDYLSSSIESIAVYYEGQRVSISKVYLLSSNSIYSQTSYSEITSDGIKTVPHKFDDDFSTLDSSKWNITDSNSRLTILDNQLYCVLQTGETASLVSQEKLEGDFDIQVSFSMVGGSRLSYDYQSGSRLGVRNSDNSVYAYVQETRSDYWRNAFLVKDADGNAYTVTSNNQLGSYGKYRLQRRGTVIYASMWYGGVWTLEWQGTPPKSADLKTDEDFYFYLYLFCGAHNVPIAITIDDFLVNTLSKEVSFGIELVSNDPIDEVKLIHSQPTEITDLDIYVSPDNNNNYSLWAEYSDITKTYNNDSYDSFLALDLGRRRAIDIMRNYGSMSNLYFINKYIKTAYSITDTDNISDVDWQSYTYLLVGTDKEYTTIQSAISAAEDHTIIYVDPGTYTEDITINKDIMLVGRTAAPEDDDIIMEGISYITYAPATEKTLYIEGITFNYNGADYTAAVRIYANMPNLNLYFNRCKLIASRSTISPFSMNHYTVKGILFENCYLERGLSHTAHIDWASIENPTGFIKCQMNNAYVDYHGDGGSPDNLDIVTIDTIDYGPAYGEFITPIRDIIAGNAASFNNTRWVRIGLLNGDSVNRNIDNLGIYPNIQLPYTLDGNYNCEWEDLGTRFSNYDLIPRNVALSPTVSGSPLLTISGSSFVTVSGSYRVTEFGPDRAVNGIKEEYGFDKCWGFLSSDSEPTLQLDFIETHTIDKIKLYHGPGNDPDYINTDYSFEISTTASGNNFVEVLSVTNNTLFEVEHTFDYVEARRVRFKITGYNHGDEYIYNSDADVYLHLDGGFLREIEIYTRVGGGVVESNEYPIVCMNLRDQFIITSHELTSDTLAYNYGSPYYMNAWDNSNEFFKYSDSHFDDPSKVAFIEDTGGYRIYFSSSEEQTPPSFEYVFEENVYLDFGNYILTWDSYEATSTDLINLQVINGDNTIDSYATLIAAGWVSQEATIYIPTSGYYTVKAIFNNDTLDVWGAGNPIIKRTSDFVKWVAVTNDTATGYSYDNDSNNYGSKILDLIKMYGDSHYIPTEYYWWWYSTISTLSNDYINVISDTRSLRIDYPTSSGIDMVEFIQGDNFGIDEVWSETDVLTLWLFISDINKFDTSYGGISFGSFKNINNLGYYMWDFEDLTLESGWNNLTLSFSEYSFTNPVKDYLRNRLDRALNFKNRASTSIGLIYRGVGQAFHMNIEGAKIERNYFNDDVHFSKGLCLTWQEYLDVPIADMRLTKGAVEFWFKPYCDSNGLDVFRDIKSKTLFTLINNNNDMISLGIRSSNWFEMGVGNAKTDYKPIYLGQTSLNLLSPSYYVQYREVVHIAMVWSNDGSHMDNNDTVRFYLNGDLVVTSKTTWDVGDTKSVNLRLGGGNTPLACNSDYEGAGIFENLKVYNYCKSDFDLSNKGITDEIKLSPNDFIQLSKDGINFYGPYDGELPFVFTQVPSGETKTIYVRTNKTEAFKRCDSKTANLEVVWLVSV